jgi:hypothetical protein
LLAAGKCFLMSEEKAFQFFACVIQWEKCGQFIVPGNSEWTTFGLWCNCFNRFTQFPQKPLVEHKSCCSNQRFLWNLLSWKNKHTAPCRQA